MRKHLKLTGILILVFVLIFSGCNSSDPYLGSSPASMSIVKVTPLENQTNVSTSTPISVTFEKDINLSTLNQKSFMLSTKDGTTVNGSLKWDSSTKTVTYSPMIALEQGTDYELTVNQVKGLNGEFIPPHVFLFKTASPFLLERVNPREGAYSVKVSGFEKQDIFAQFNQSVDESSVTSANFYAIEDNGQEEFPTTLNAIVDYTESLKMVSLRPISGRLRYSTKYYVTLRDVKATGGNLFAEHRWSFDTEEAKVTATIPANNSGLTCSSVPADCISTGVDIQVYFQAPVDKNTVAAGIKLKKAFGLQEEFFFKGEPVYDMGDTKVTFRTKISAMDQGLLNNSAYEIVVEGVTTTLGEKFKTYRARFVTQP